MVASILNKKAYNSKATLIALAIDYMGSNNMKTIFMAKPHVCP